MGKFDILNNGVPLTMDKTKNYVKQEDTTIAEISDLSNLTTTEVGFIGHKANIHKAELTDRNISVLDEKIHTVKTTKLDASAYTATDVLNKIKTVDGSGSGLDADTLDGYNSSTTNTANTVVVRDAAGFAALTGLNLAAGADTSSIQWNSTVNTFDVPLNGTTYQMGQESLIYAKASSAITKGQVVMFSGAQGDHILVAPGTTAALTANSKYLVGVAAESIAIGNFGFITWFGTIGELNTSAWTEGSVLYFDNTVTGGLTTTVPSAPNAKITVCAVTRQHATEGSILVRPDFGYKLSNIQDVNISSIVPGDSLYWDGTKFINTPSYTKTQVDTALGTKQATLVSGTNIKTVNGSSLLGSGDMPIYTGFKNYMINGNFDVWQRGTSFPITSGQYTADRWKFYSSGSYTVTKSSVTLPTNKVVNTMRINCTASATSYIDGYQLIEDYQKLSNRTFTISCWAKTSLSGVYIRQGSTQNFGDAIPNDGQWHYIVRTFTLGTVTSNSINPNGSGFGVTFMSNPYTSSDYIEFTDFQFEEGSVATPFENRPYGLELALCQRYFKKINKGRLSGIAGYNQIVINGTTEDFFGGMRTVNSLYTFGSIPSYYISGTTQSNGSISSISPNEFGINVTVTNHSSGSNYWFDLTSSNYINIDAEL